MSIARAYSLQARNLSAETIVAEVDISNGLNSFSIVGLGDRAVNEAKDRISAAIKNSGFVSPKQKNQKVVVSLAPADSPKEGTSFDHAMAIAYLAAAGHMPEPPESALFFGETSLTGELRKCSNLLQSLHSIGADDGRFSEIFVPRENEREARLAIDYGLCDSGEISIFIVGRITETINHISGKRMLEPLEKSAPDTKTTEMTGKSEMAFEIDFADIRGNIRAKRALEIAVSGFHHSLLYGPPGTGKTVLAKGCASICPDLAPEHIAEVASIYSAAGLLDERDMRRPPFRAPHHTASYVAIIGGGPTPKPGEVTLAHRGVLFADEFPEFSTLALEGLRQPLEEGAVTISRAVRTATFPARCLLVAAMNPCPCGRGGTGGCICSNSTLDKYRRRISGPIADRIDIWAHVDMIPYRELCGPETAQADEGGKTETSQDIRKRVSRTRRIQRDRFLSYGIDKHFNGEMTAEDIDKVSKMSMDARRALEMYARTHATSGRAIHRIIKVSRTIADIERSEEVLKKHVLEALAYRRPNI